MIQASLNELKFAIRWAALGAHAPVGLADDFARASVECLAMGLDALALVTAAIANIAAQQSWGHLILEPTADGTLLHTKDGKPLSILEAGPALADLLETSGEPLNVVELDMPGLLPGYLLACQHPVTATLYWHTADGHEISVAIENGALLSFTAPEPAAYSAGVSGMLHLVPDGSPPQSALIDGGAISDARREAVERGVRLHESDWLLLQMFTAKAWVRATELSRLQGAGAGLLDDD